MSEEIGKTEGVQTQKPKRVMTQATKDKMKEGRIRALAARAGRKAKRDAKGEQKPPVPEIRVPKKDLQFFGEGDRKKDGKIASEYPSIYFKPQIEELEEEIKKMEGRVARGIVPTSELPIAVKAIEREKAKLDRIRMDEGNVKGHEDALNKCQKEVGEILHDCKYSRTDDGHGTTDPHEVAERWTKPCISLSPEARALAAKANIPMTADGKVNEIGADKLWKLCRAGLGESTNAEILRRG